MQCQRIHNRRAHSHRVLSPIHSTPVYAIKNRTKWSKNSKQDLSKIRFVRPFDTPCRAVLCCAVLGVLNQPGQYLRTAKNCYHQWDFMHASKHPHPAHTDTPTANNTQNEQHSGVVLFVAYLLGRLQRTECQLHCTDFFCLGYLAIFHSFHLTKEENKRKLCLTKLFHILNQNII